jgi:hypothetical protein
MKARFLPHAAAVAALGVLALSLHFNLGRLCAPSANSACSPGAQPPAQAAALRREIAANPALASAYVLLASSADAGDAAGTVRAASIAAPQEPNVLRARAQWHLAHNQLAQATADLVQLTEYYHAVAREPSVALARLVAAGHGELLRPHLQPGRQWFGVVLSTMIEEKIPLSAAGTLMTQASATGVLPPRRLSELMRGLKEAGNWVDAYGLWAGEHGGRVPVLYNGNFEQPFARDGFDWETSAGPAGRAGALAERRRLPARGPVLEIQFTGKPIAATPIRQVVFAGPGRYVISGQYRTENLRTEKGLVWTVRCAAGKAANRAGASAPLVDSQGTWAAFRFEASLPADCGPVSSLQVETADPSESNAGLRGRIPFDTLTWTPAGPLPS